jgi:hypothetical protein
MRISIANCPGTVSEKQLREASRFFASSLMSRRIARKLNVNIVFTKLKKFQGTVTPVDDSVPYPRDFDIEIEPRMSKCKIFLALAHEFIHIKQFATGELKDFVRTPKTRWKKRIYNTSDDNDINSPWEKQCLVMENQLYHAWRSQKS